MVSWLFVSDVVPTVVKRLLRAWSKLLLLCATISAGETGGTVVGAIVAGAGRGAGAGRARRRVAQVFWLRVC